MSKTPPGDDDSAWTDVIEQVKVALDDARITDPDTQEALVQGVRGALESLALLGWGASDGAESDAAALGPEVTGPEVTVMEGGRQGADPAQPSAGGTRPDLRVAQAPSPDPDLCSADDASTEDPAGDGAEASSRRVVASVHVLRGAGQASADAAVEGWIASNDPDDWQTVFRGDEARPYRINCTRGALRVAIDGVPADRLRAGQSLDAQARLLRVAADPGPAAGTYVRLARG